MTANIKNKILVMIIVISTLLIGFVIGCLITPGSIICTKEKIVTKPCEHINLNEECMLQHSIINHCNDCNQPAQRILYDVKNDVTYIYTYYYKYRSGYTHMLELTKIDVIKINKDGSTEFHTN